jgi:hypothetical protein
MQMSDGRAMLRAQVHLIVTELGESAIDLRKEIARLEDALTIKKTMLAEREKAIWRAKTFELARNGDYQCPSCWIKNERHSDLKPVSQTTIPSEDHFKCRECGFYFAVEA